ncbi:MAG: hypothetical protein KDK40_00610, partial [Chlamydiia bacterium]|nr:hypothetical protein [Chlamydiia bacterium]
VQFELYRGVKFIERKWFEDPPVATASRVGSIAPAGRINLLLKSESAGETSAMWPFSCFQMDR